MKRLEGTRIAALLLLLLVLPFLLAPTDAADRTAHQEGHGVLRSIPKAKTAQQLADLALQWDAAFRREANLTEPAKEWLVERESVQEFLLEQARDKAIEETLKKSANIAAKAAGRLIGSLSLAMVVLEPEPITDDLVILDQMIQKELADRLYSVEPDVFGILQGLQNGTLPVSGAQWRAP